jgi:hypothetical protein
VLKTRNQFSGKQVSSNILTKRGGITTMSGEWRDDRCSNLPVDGCYGFSGPIGDWTASRNPFPALNFGVLRAGITMS